MLSKKYRPSTFADLIGQEDNVIILKEYIKNGLITPLLFTGPFGSGKTSASRVTAKAILCQNLNENLEPCCKCQSCIDFSEDRNINYTEIDAASNGDVESIRNLREQVGYSSIGSKFKITNIDEAHNITKAGYNALLKQLEEGYEHHIFMFCTNEPEKMLSTVRSRCWRIHSQAVSSENLFEYVKNITVKEKISAEEKALKLICDVTSPHIRDALNALDFLNYKGSVNRFDVEVYFQIADKNKFLEMLIYLKKDLPKALQALDELVGSYDIDTIFSKLVEQCLILESKIKGVNLKHDYVDSELLEQALSLKIDFLGVSSYLLKVDRNVDIIYLKHLLLELNRILNDETTAQYGNPVHIIRDIQVINSTQIGDISKNIENPIETTTIISPEEVSFSGFDISNIMKLSDAKPKKLNDTQKLKSVNVKTAFGSTKGAVENEQYLTNKIGNKPVPVSDVKAYLDIVLAKNDSKKKQI